MSNINLDELLAQRAEATGVKEGRVSFTYKGEDFFFSDPLLLSDDDAEEFDALTHHTDKCMFLMGEDEYDRFIEAGGTSFIFGIALNEYSEESRGFFEGKNSPGNRSSRRKAARARKR